MLSNSYEKTLKKDAHYKQIKRLPLEKCFSEFKSFVIDDFSIDEIINSAISCNLKEFFLRTTMWKLFLAVLPNNNNLSHWIRTSVEQRKDYEKKISELRKLKNYKSHPLNKVKNVLLF
jgi:hypothetical protein